MPTLSWMLHQHDKQFIWQGEHLLSLSGFSSAVSRTSSTAPRKSLPTPHCFLPHSCLHIFYSSSGQLNFFFFLPISSTCAEAEIGNRKAHDPSEKENLFFLPHCPDWLKELEELNGPRRRTTQHLWSSGTWCYPKWEGLSQNPKVWIMPNVFRNYISTLRGEKENQTNKKNPNKTSINHQQNLIFNSSHENLNMTLQLLHVSNSDPIILGFAGLSLCYKGFHWFKRALSSSICCFSSSLIYFNWTV